MIHELRHYVPTPGKEAALLARFRDRVITLFDRHGFVLQGFWVAEADAHIWYMLAWEDRELRARKWQAFLADPEWDAVRRDTEADSPLVERIESTLLRAPDLPRSGQ